MRRSGRLIGIAVLGAVLIAGCSTTQKSRPSSFPSSGSRGGYYQDDGPADKIPVDLDRVADAVPRVEPYASGPNKPYSVFGHEYVPDTSDRASSEQGIGSWYGRKFNGQKTSSGETYDMFAMTAASPTLPIPSYARVTNPGNGRSVIVRINDRGPFHPGRIIDLSYAAAYKLGYIGSGSTAVQVDRILPSDIRAGRIPIPNASPPPEPPVLLASTPQLSGATLSAPIPPAAAPPIAPIAPIAAGAEPLAATARAAAPANLYDQLPADLMPSEVALTARPGVSALVNENAGVIAAPLGDGVFLQLAAFRVKSGADSFVSHMDGELDPGLSQRLRVSAGNDFYRVQLGPYASRSEALGAAERLRADLGIAPMIVTPN